MLFKDKKIVIIGGSSGIGLAVANCDLLMANDYVTGALHLIDGGMSVT